MAEPDRRGSTPSPARLAPEDISTRAFSSAFRGLNESEVRSFLQRVADELAQARERMAELERELEARRSAPSDAPPLDEGALLDALGEETTKLLRNAREAAKDIRARAEETAARLRADAQADAERVRAEANELLDVRTREADSVAAETLARAEAAVEERRREVEEQVNAELEEAKSRGRAMVDEARAVRERMLADLAHRRGLLQAQVAELRAGRDHLLDAYRVVKRTFLEATDSLSSVEARFAQSRPRPLDESEIEAALRPDAGESASAELAESVELDAEREPQPPSDTESQPPSDGEAQPESAAATSDDAEAAEAPETTPAVGDLFARIRAESVEAPPEPAAADAPAAEQAISAEPEAATPSATEAAAESATPDTAGDAEPAPVAEVRPGPLDRASTALAPVLVSGARRAKRALQDEQNRVLDALRRHKGKPHADAVLPSDDEQIATWKTVVGDALARAYIAGRRDVDPDQSSTIDVPDDLAQSNVAVLLSTLRERLVAALEHHDAEGASDRVSARYREWKSQDLEARLEDVVRSAYARGVYDAAPDESELEWVLAAPRCCADCADNALEPVTKGKSFPTGQPYPPAHPGCRCVLQLRAEVRTTHQ